MDNYDFCMKDKLKAFYLFVKTFPDRMYPFRVEIEGRFFRGKTSYELAVNQAWEKYGPHHLGFKLTMYRDVFHFMGAVVFILLMTLLSHRFLNSEAALYVLMGSAILALFVQEFYYHPKYYSQPLVKGITDWLSWVVPMMAYLFLFR
jgi:hypothetical protein